MREPLSRAPSTILRGQEESRVLAQPSGNLRPTDLLRARMQHGFKIDQSSSRMYPQDGTHERMKCSGRLASPRANQFAAALHAPRQRRGES